ncbi:MAG: hypothetical protein HC800_00145 [Phormidesmis sp. RL_2_1]|nr:hypothetical protein [Phormidesmis sp. RL_2_1]
MIFLDNLQWADTTSLKLLQLLMADDGHLMMIGAYRDNEVSKSHLLTLAIEEICALNTAHVNRLRLTPLTLQETNHLVADTLHHSLEFAQPLAKLIYQKTGGNPFLLAKF